ncbi:MAG: hypothetical protein M1434_02710 [Chloroflexi bacterium]|nr:hypothetical protein [Chloroflexota bacterium]MCL5273641.1 hypothetical protein [Chloroflexota bacterium]
MNKPAPTRQRIFIILAIAALVVLATGVVALGLRDFVSQVIVQPVAYILWLAGLIFRSIPQSMFWGLVVAVAILAAWRSLGLARAALFARRRPPGPTIPDQPDRSILAAMFDDLARMRDSAFAREKVAFELRGLLVKLLAYREREPAAQIERRIRDGQLVTPPEVRTLLADWQHWLSGPPANPWARRWQRILVRLGLGRPDPRGPLVSCEERLDAVIAYMEQIVGGPVPPGNSSKEQHD